MLGQEIIMYSSSLFNKLWVVESLSEGDLCENYKDGDEIFIFGFSRGAAIGRMLACKIFEKGINEHIPKIKFVGVWDTVASIGVPNLKDSSRPISDCVFENGTIAENIVKAVHLIAIDETRKAFRPVLMNISDRVEEVWFAGVHSDVGGGYRLDGLSDVSLAFMMKRAVKEGLCFISEDEIEYANLKGEKGEVIEKEDVAVKPDLKTKVHEHKRDGKKAALTLAPRNIVKVLKDKPTSDHIPVIHHSVIERCKIKPGYRPRNLVGVKHIVLDKDDTLKEYGGLENHEV